MTNGEKYKTAKEREDAFCKLCEKRYDCEGCVLETIHNRSVNGRPACIFAWLDLEAEEESFEDVVEEMRNRMIDREHSPTLWPFVDRLVAAHNRVAKAAKESEAK